VSIPGEDGGAMYKALSPGAVQVRPSGLEEAIALASRHGFQGVEFNPREVSTLIDEQGVDFVGGLFTEAGLHPAGFGLPVDWRNEEEKWQSGLAELPRLAEAAAAIGCRRSMTWILSSSDEREYDANRRFHVERFKPAAEILHQHGIWLGLEFLGPKTLRDARKYPFIYKLWDMVALGQEIGPNVGLLLDSWHWYTSGATVEDLRRLRPEQVVYVHVNDAPAGIPVDEQIDNHRALPGETGVIDIAGFLSALRQIGYNGPITPEPFKAELKELSDDDARLAVVARAMDDIFQKAGLP
jgi:sugar phosphate isomerase/epimerase